MPVQGDEFRDANYHWPRTFDRIKQADWLAENWGDQASLLVEWDQGEYADAWGIEHAIATGHVRMDVVA